VRGVGSLALHQEIVEGFRVGLRGKISALRGGQLHDALPSFGRLHHAADRRNVRERASHDFIGGDHEVFDQVGRAILFLLHDVGHLVVDDDWPDLNRLDVERAVQVTLLAQRLGDGVLQSELGLEFSGGGDCGWRGCFVIEPRADGAVGQLRLIANQGAIEVVRSDVTIVADDEFNHDGGVVLILEQRSETGGEHLGDHGEIADTGVDRRRLGGGVLIDGAVARDIGVDVGNADQDLDVAVRELFGDFDLVEVAGGVVVDGGPQQVAEVASSPFVAGAGFDFKAASCC